MKIALKSMPKQTHMKMSHEDNFLFDKNFLLMKQKNRLKTYVKVYTARISLIKNLGQGLLRRIVIEMKKYRSGILKVFARRPANLLDQGLGDQLHDQVQGPIVRPHNGLLLRFIQG